jgi:hypothetical protein
MAPKRRKKEAAAPKSALLLPAMLPTRQKANRLLKKYRYFKVFHSNPLGTT